MQNLFKKTCKQTSESQILSIPPDNQAETIAAWFN